MGIHLSHVGVILPQYSILHAMGEEAILTYTDTPGLARTIRITLCLTGIKVI